MPTRPGSSGRLISVVIPALNEEKNLAQLIPELHKELGSYGYAYEIIVVDGHSRDNTAKVSEKLGAIVIYDDRGKGSALVKGLRRAKGDILIAMDADLSHEPRELKLLIDAIEIGYDVCMGSRFIIGGGSEDIPWFRVLGNKFFVFLVNVIFGANYTDMCYGYRSFRKGVPEKLDLQDKGFGIETEISIKAIKKHLRIIEVPSTEKKRASGEGKLRTFGDGSVILRTILANIF
jgi:glycosyltransferase involved in cell wall biosynthesis